MMHLIVALAEKILLTFAYCDKDFVLAYQLGEEADLDVLRNCALRMNRREIPCLRQAGSE